MRRCAYSPRMDEKALSKLRSAEARAEEARRASAVAAERHRAATERLDAALAGAAEVLGAKVTPANALKLLDAEARKAVAAVSEAADRLASAADELHALLDAAGAA